MLVHCILHSKICCYIAKQRLDFNEKKWKQWDHIKNQPVEYGMTRNVHKLEAIRLKLSLNIPALASQTSEDNRLDFFKHEIFFVHIFQIGHETSKCHMTFPIFTPLVFTLYWTDVLCKDGLWLYTSPCGNRAKWPSEKRTPVYFTNI